jgi:hypothetical protein
MRKTIGLTESDPVKQQAADIANALIDGRPAVLDAKDMVDLLVTDTAPLDSIALDLQAEISLILGLPISWVAGKQKVGLGDSGDADARSIERGLEPYFWESIHPAFSLLFGINLKFKSENYQNVSQGLEALKTMELVSDDYISKDNKILLVSKLLDVVPDGTEGSERDDQVLANTDPKKDSTGKETEEVNQGRPEY